MGSKLVINRQKSSETVQSAGKNYEGIMVAKTGALLGEEAGQAAGVLVRSATARLGELTQNMVTADDRHLNEIADDAQTLGTRDEAVASTRAGLMEVRELCGTVYGPEYVRKLGFDGNTPSDPVQLERLATQVLANFDTASRPATARFGLNLDVTQLKEQLAPEVAALTAALAAISEDVRQADMKLVEKRQAMDVYDKGFSATADLISTLLKLSGEEELAKRVRPSVRRPGQTIEDAEETAAPIEAPSEQSQVDVA